VDCIFVYLFFFFSSRRRHTRSKRDWSSDVCSSDLPLLQFGRCVVHFAVDPDEVFMTTKLEGDNTNFLPFNKGHNQGSGNPPNPFGHKTAYLWEEVLTKHSLANLLEHFVRFDGKPTTPLSKKTLFFPRYHQLDVVRKLLRDVRSKGVGQRYLIQHSAGSGKSHS